MTTTALDRIILEAMNNEGQEIKLRFTRDHEDGITRVPIQRMLSVTAKKATGRIGGHKVTYRLNGERISPLAARMIFDAYYDEAEAEYSAFMGG